jgi:acyl transferase domain-containing protein
MSQQKIAIVGMSALFPGSETLDQFWKNLLEEKNLISDANFDDFGVEPISVFQNSKGVLDRCYSISGGYIRDFNFDPQGYLIDADKLNNYDKLYQWSLYVAKEALAHAGYKKEDEVVKKCGVVMGNLSFPTSSTHKQLANIYASTLADTLKDFAPNINIPSSAVPSLDNDPLQGTSAELIKAGLGLQGLAYDLDAACSSSLYAMKLACDELILGKSDMMLAGAVCGSDSLFIHMGFSIFHAYASNEEVFAPLDKNSGGLVSSEGAGMVVLKRLEDAERDGDNILGVIAGIGLSNDGRGKFILSPNQKGQEKAFERAYTNANLDPSHTSYVECHATGTPLGDITEINSMAAFFKGYNTKPLLGSVKSNMGHLLTAAGFTGLFKVLMAMKHEVIPANINTKNPIASDDAWLGQEQMILAQRDWSLKSKQAGINSFGFGGTNAHMIIQEHEEKSTTIKKISKPSLQSMAIIGMDVHFGKCIGIDQCYDAIFYGKQYFDELPPSRWKGFEQNKELLQQYGFEDQKPPKGNYIEEFDFDSMRYKIPPNELATLEPQQALILKVADKAIQNAGLAEGGNVAVLIAMSQELAIHHYLARWDSEWQLDQALENGKWQISAADKTTLKEAAKNSLYSRSGDQTPSQHTSFVGNVMACRISSLWNFSGPAFTITQEEDSLYAALEVAQNMLSLGEVEAVVLGSVDFAGGLESVLLRNAIQRINTNDKPSIFLNAQDEGWLVGEGAGVIILKRNDTVTVEDNVFGVIENLGSLQSTNQQVDYFELNASYTQKSEQTLIENLTRQNQINPAALGSVQATIGHCFFDKVSPLFKA